MRAVFLDRDGVINENRDAYVTCPEELRLLPGVLGALAALAASPYRIVVVTNQAGVGRGRLTHADLDQIHAELLRLVREADGRIDAIYACPHHPAAGCACRKPEPGLLLRAARDLSLDLTGSFFVGDSFTDVQAARGAGCRPVVVLTGHGQATYAALSETRDDAPWIAKDLAHAIALILNNADQPWSHAEPLPELGAAQHPVPGGWR